VKEHIVGEEMLPNLFRDDQCCDHASESEISYVLIWFRQQDHKANMKARNIANSKRDETFEDKGMRMVEQKHGLHFDPVMGAWGQAV
jgi:hypothetical protein